MKYLVIGGHGFIGSHFCKRLKHEEYDVFDTFKPNEDPSIDVIVGRTKGVKDTLKEIPKLVWYDYVIHFGSLAGVRSGHSDIDFFRENVIPLQEFMAKHRNFGKLIYISSSSVLGDNETAYSLSKRICEGIVLADNDSPGLVIRPYTVYGKYGRPGMFITRCLNNDIVAVNGDPESIRRRFTYVEDLVDCILEWKDKFGVINAIGVNEYSLGDILRITNTEARTGPASEFDFHEQRKPETDFYYECKTRFEDVVDLLMEK